MKITLAQLGTLQEARRLAAMERFLSGTPRPKPNAKPVTATALERATKLAYAEINRAMRVAFSQIVDMLVFGTAVTQVYADGRVYRVDPRKLYGRQPFPFLWRWRRNPKPVYGRGHGEDRTEDLTE
ncbi:MAG: hypothetical protein WC683_07680 [bacterium]|jgi:hypothetical protein